MGQQPRRRDEKDVPNHSSNMEQAEGSRENVKSGSAGKNTGGITNRELDREQREQEHVPDRGRDAGRTMGGGSLGHGSERDATLPDDADPSVNTKI
jgi:hypothetical protein